MNRFPLREQDEMESQWQSRFNGSIGGRVSSSPLHILSSWSSWQIINRQSLISANVQSQKWIMYSHSVMKARVNNKQFLRVQVIVKVGRAYNPSQWIGLNPACRLNSRCTSICRDCTLLFVHPLWNEVSWRNHLVLTRYYAQHFPVSDN